MAAARRPRPTTSPSSALPARSKAIPPASRSRISGTSPHSTAPLPSSARNRRLADGDRASGRRARPPVSLPFRHAATTGGWRDQPVLLRLVSIALFAAIWEIAGRIPVSFAFPTFSDTLVAFVGLIADGSLPKRLSLDAAAAGARRRPVGVPRRRPRHALRPVAHRRMAADPGVHRAAGGTRRRLHPDGHLRLRHRHDRQDACRHDPGAAGHRAQHLQGGAQRQRVAARHVPLVPRHALAGGRQDHPSRMPARSSSPACASASPPASSASCWPNC